MFEHNDKCQFERIDFFVFEQRNHEERIDKMVNIVKKELTVEEELKKRINFICDFCNTKPEFINGSIRTIDKTNLTYIEPHRVIIKDVSFLFFNYSNDFYVENLNNKIPINELERYLKSI
ncbi:MAG: hypothetical protein PHW90_03210 [Bacilli bacterium]|nr:hypothetical protein [Bacilli bacterium]